MLTAWQIAVSSASTPNTRHLLLFAGETPSFAYASGQMRVGIQVVTCPPPDGKSIGWYHNYGAEIADTEWIMKLDVDCLPHQNYFKNLLPLLAEAKEREWFNGGMLYTEKDFAESRLGISDLPITEATYHAIMRGRSRRAVIGGSNFICRKADYLATGGCDVRFSGYGWEDYYQLYLLEHNLLRRDPLQGTLTMENVTIRCREELSRQKAVDLLMRDPSLCLLHKWHPPGPREGYRHPAIMQNNRTILFETINRMRRYGR